MENIKEAGYSKPTPIQRHSLPIVMGGRDLMGCAQTGSGKTAAFLLPILALLLKQGVGRDRPSGYKAYPQALILAPTRELACQIQDEAKKFGFRTGIKSTVVYGGAPMNSQLWELKSGCDLLVATPGRLVDIIERGNVSLSRIRFLVLDEADRMLDMGFEPQIRKIVEQLDMPRTGQRHTLMFSATFPKEIQMLASSFLHDYIFLAVGRVGAATETVTQKFVQVEQHAKDSALFTVINSVPGLTLIFVETKKQAEYLGRMLQRQGVPAQSIHGDKQQSLRTAAIRSFASGQTPFLIATNVAARGLDIDNVAHVINYDMPNTIEDYVHRIGRTGRAGKSGISTSFISSSLHGHVIPKLVELLQDANQPVPDWMMQIRGSSYGGKSRGPRTGPRFGGKDYRKQGGGFFGGSSGGSSTPSSYGSGSSSTSSYSRPGYPPSTYPTSGYPSASTSAYSAYPLPATATASATTPSSGSSTTSAYPSYGGSSYSGSSYGSSYGSSSYGSGSSSYGSGTSSYGAGSGSSYGSGSGSSYGSGSGSGSSSYGSGSGSSYGSSSSSTSRDYDRKRGHDDDDDRSGKRHSSSSSRDSYSSSHPSSASSSSNGSSYSSGSSSSSYPSSSSSSSYPSSSSSSSHAKPPPPPASTYGPPPPPGYAYPPPPPAAAYAAAYPGMAYPLSMMGSAASTSTSSTTPRY
jgi:ATP-dependent RNA helicase DDX3X